MKQIAEIKESLQAVEQNITQVRVDIAALKVKAGVWGSIAALLAIATLAVIDIFKR